MASMRRLLKAAQSWRAIVSPKPLNPPLSHLPSRLCHSELLFSLLDLILALLLLLIIRIDVVSVLLRLLFEGKFAFFFVRIDVVLIMRFSEERKLMLFFFKA